MLPSALSIRLLRIFGYRIGKGCKIGFSYIDADDVDIGDYSRIGHGNLLWRLQSLKMGAGSKVGDFNWITGASKGKFELGENSSIRRFHYFEASGGISIGDNTVVAGRSTLFFSHGISPSNLNDVRQIEIGSWCYIGAAVRFLPGAGVSDGTFVGMGSVVTKYHTNPYVLIAGNPAIEKRELNRRDIYFDRAYLPHASHPPEYQDLQDFLK